MYIGINDLEEGLILDEPIYFNNSLIIDKGKKLSSSNVDFLKRKQENLSISKVKVSLESFDKDNLNVFLNKRKWNHNEIDCEINNSFINQIKKEISLLDTKNSNFNLDVNQIVQKLIDELYKSLKQNRTININPNDYYKDDQLSHAIRVSIMCFMVAYKYNNSNNKAEDNINYNDLITASLLYNYGEKLSDKNTLSKVKDLLANSYFAKMYNLKNDFSIYNPDLMPIYSYSILPISNTARNIILYGGENRVKDGPLRVNVDELKLSNNIKQSAKILNLCSRFDEVLTIVFNNSTNENCVNAINDIENIILRWFKSEKFDNTFLHYLIDDYSLFPDKVRVQLNDGRFAKVIGNEKGGVYPQVITMNNEILDLNDFKDTVFIKRVIPNDESLDQYIQPSYNIEDLPKAK